MEKVIGDLCNPGSPSAACDGLDYVIATANSAVPRKASDKLDAIEGQGYRDLIDAALHYGVRQFLFTSVISMRKAQKFLSFVRSGPLNVICKPAGEFQRR